MKQESLFAAFRANFLGQAPEWYKLTILAFLVINPLVMWALGPYVAGWLMVGEFIFTLAMALKCYPLQPGGLLALEAIFMGMTTPGTVVHEIESALEVLLLLIFMVAGIYFLRDMLLYIFTKVLVRVRSKVALALLFSLLGAVLSAFLDALTVTAVVITVALGFYSVYHRVASGKHFDDEHDAHADEHVDSLKRTDLEQFRAFLRSIMMHAAVGTALGGVTTLVGEPQNIIIGNDAGWNFIEFFFRMAPVTLPVLFVGLMTVIFLEVTGMFGYGARIPPAVLKIMEEFEAYESAKLSTRDKLKIAAQAVVAIWLVIGLMFHLAAVGLIGLSVIILATTFSGVVEEHQIGHAFQEALPFTALLVVFFAIVAMINDQGLFDPVTNAVLALEGNMRIAALYMANGVLSVDQRQRLRRHRLHLGGGQGAGRRHDRPGHLRSHGGRGEHRHQHPLGRDPERPGGVPVPAHLLARAADPAVLHAHGDHGAAVYDRDDDHGLRRRLFLARARDRLDVRPGADHAPSRDAEADRRTARQRPLRRRGPGGRACAGSCAGARLCYHDPPCRPRGGARDVQQRGGSPSCRDGRCALRPDQVVRPPPRLRLSGAG
ncbi:MAG: hypothetical protein KatS3mg119_0040 [Rhodothalassiaceae bacterium]|nr:MAG: hypothetical protein KatS3mg119_0040 [Rhodothalassiaceae bacterium]